MTRSLRSRVAQIRSAAASRLQDRSRDPADIVLLAIALICSALLLVLLASFQYGRDQGIYALVAEQMLQGGVPYRDAWDFKPPGIFLVYAAAQLLIGREMAAIRLLEAAGFASLIYAFAILSRRHLGDARAGILGGALALLTHVQLDFWHTAQPSSFGAVALSWAIVCAGYRAGEAASRRGGRQVGAWLGAGLLYGLAALMKPQLGGGLAVSLAIVARHRWRMRSASQGGAVLFAPLLSLAAGAAVPVLGVLLYFVAVGAGPELRQALVEFAPRYTAVSFRNDWLGGLLLRAIREWALRFSILNLAGFTLLLGLPTLGRREREGLVHVAGVIAMVLLGVALQAKFFPYHYGAALALGALPAGWGFWKLWLLLRHRPLTAGAFCALLALLVLLRPATRGVEGMQGSFWTRSRMRIAAMLDPSVRTAANDALHNLGDMDAGSDRRVAEWLRANTRPADRLFIWGFEPVIYALAQRPPASRYLYNIPQRVDWARERSRRLLLEDLARSQPEAIVVAHRDRLPWVTGNRLDSAETLQHFPALRALLERHYRWAGALGDFDLYLRDRP